MKPYIPELAIQMLKQPEKAPGMTIFLAIIACKGIKKGQFAQNA
jgi:hypothetical protein